MKHIYKILFISLFALLFFSSAQSAKAWIPRFDCEVAADENQSQNLCLFSSNSLSAYGTAFSIGLNGKRTLADNGELTGPRIGGAINGVGDSLAFFYKEPPASSAIYVADVIHNFQGPTAYAQGLGFTSLNPVLQVWKAFRNLSYFLFILVFIAIGFMIMFRSQVNHQMVVTAQMALPKIIITLILITFSYAIAGLVIDFIYISIYFMTTLFAQAGIIGDLETVRKHLFNESILKLGASLFAFDTDGTWSAAQGFTEILTGITWAPLEWVSDVFFWIILGLAVLIALLRTFFQLLAAYVGIILSVIFAPIQLLANAFPGSESFKNWIMNLIANAAVFPVIAAMILIGAALVGGDNSEIGGVSMLPSGINEDGWTPPFISSQRGSPDGIRAVIGIGIVMLLPTVGQITKQMFGVEANAYTGQVIGSVFAAPKMVMGVGGTALNTLYQVSHIRAGFFDRNKKNRPGEGPQKPETKHP